MVASRTRVLQLLDSAGVGGAQRLIPGLIDGLDTARFESHLGFLGDGELRPQFERLGVPLYIVGARRFYAPWVVPAVARYVREHRIDLIHTHLTDADIVGRIAGALTGVPVVSTLHNIPLDYNRQKAHRRALQRLTARTLAARLVMVSPSIGAEYVRQWGLPASKIVAINNAVPMAPYLAVPEGVPEGLPPTVTTVARLSEQKGQSLLLQAARTVLQARPDVRFRIVGDGPLHDALRRQAAELGVEGAVSFDGVRHDVPEILTQSEVFVLSSLWEGLPVTAVEAMSAARACVLTDVGGCRDLVTSGVEGLLVPPGDPGALAAGLLDMLGSVERRRTFGRRAREKARRDFSMEQYLRGHESLYEQVLGSVRQVGAAAVRH